LGKPAITSKTSVKPVSSVGSVGMDFPVGLEGSLQSSPIDDNVSEKLSITIA
jgi:hypothetical protein